MRARVTLFQPSGMPVLVRRTTWAQRYNFKFLDAGASARSADRPALQAMLERLKSGGVDYVIVHKVDRLARDRADDVMIALAIHRAGAKLISVTEAVDATPAGTLLHGIMAAISEFYSNNLSQEAKKGLHEKAKTRRHTFLCTTWLFERHHLY